MAAETTTWNAELYQSSHAFVWQFGRDLGLFASHLLASEQREEMMQRIETLARPALFHDGLWTVDYKRLRIIAVKQ